MTDYLILLVTLMNKLNESSSIRATIFIEEDKSLLAFQTSPIPESFSLRKNNTNKDIFNLETSQSLVCQSWNENQTIIKNQDIHFLHTKQATYISSIICVPISLENYGKICILSLDSESKDTFSMKEQDEKIILDIGKRIALEIISFHSIKKGSNNE